MKGDLADSQFFCQFLIIFDIDGSRSVTEVLFFRKSLFGKEFFHCFVAFRMYTGRIQRILSALDTHETGTLFKGFRSQFGYF